jgi:L-threonylcarbamoyladenylate synthase
MAELKEAQAALDEGLVIVVPTDTVYGMAARLDRPDAIRSIFEIKGRPEDKPLPVLGADIAQLDGVAEFDAGARKLAESFWPGPLTLVLTRAPGFTVDLGGDPEDGTVGVRVPRSDVLLRLLQESGPLAVTSANRSGRSPASSVEEAQRAFGETAAAYLDGGRAQGFPSTVVALVDEVRLLRQGEISLEAIHRCLGRPDR